MVLTKVALKYKKPYEILAKIKQHIRGSQKLEKHRINLWFYHFCYLKILSASCTAQRLWGQNTGPPFNVRKRS